MRPKILALYFFGVSFLTLAWWALIFSFPHVQRLFFRSSDRDWLLAFLLPDFIIYSTLPVIIGTMLLTGRAKVQILIAAHLGGAIYAALFTWMYFGLTQAGFLGAVLMSVSLIIPAYALVEKQ